jgi:hypothetical protein
MSIESLVIQHAFRENYFCRFYRRRKGVLVTLSTKKSNFNQFSRNASEINDTLTKLVAVISKLVAVAGPLIVNQ